MSDIVRFPSKAGIRIIEGTSMETGLAVYLLEYVQGDSRNIVAEYSSLVELAYGILEWEVDGVPVIEQLGGAA